MLPSSAYSSVNITLLAYMILLTIVYCLATLPSAFVFAPHHQNYRHHHCGFLVSRLAPFSIRCRCISTLYIAIILGSLRTTTITDTTTTTVTGPSFHIRIAIQPVVVLLASRPACIPSRGSAYLHSHSAVIPWFPCSSSIRRGVSSPWTHFPIFPLCAFRYSFHT